MDLPTLEHQAWYDVISGDRHYPFDSVALKILLRTLAKSCAEDSSQENLRQCAGMLRDLFAQNISNPSLQHDLKKIFADRTLDGL